MRVWHYLHGEWDKKTIQTILASLHNCGVISHPLKFSTPSGPGIVFFTCIDGSLLNFLHKTSRNSLERVVAISKPGITLRGDSPWRLLKAGASDVISWNQNEEIAREIVERFKRWEIIDNLLGSSDVRGKLIGESNTWKSVLRKIVEMAYYTDVSILIRGESGTGKELVANLIHALDQRKPKGEFVVLDCTTIVPDLAGSELFGHEVGAFTGAVASREGAFALADGGTLFLDEVGELPPTLQPELLRVIQEHAYKRVGSDKWRHTNFRLVCATNQDLFKEIERGLFRRDLFYRITGWSCRLPSLNERVEDILPLVRHFISQHCPDEKVPELDDPVRECILRRSFPGNVRELKQFVSRVMHRHIRSGPITVGCIPEEDRPVSDLGSIDWCDESFEQAIRHALSLGRGLKEIGRVAENAAIRIAIEEENGSLRRASQRLGVTDRALQLRRAADRMEHQKQVGTPRNPRPPQV